MKLAKKFPIIVVLLLFIILGVAATHKPANSFKNLKVLPKDISDKELDKIMDEFSNSLGVKCTFCHVHTGDDWHAGWDMASDDKPEKAIARKMIAMTNKINKKFFHGKSKYGEENAVMEVRCMTCHHKQPHPEMDEEMEKKTE